MNSEAARWQRLIDGLRAGDRQIAQEFWDQYGKLLHGVADKHLDSALHWHCPDLNPASLRRELDRIGQQVQHDLSDLAFIRPNLTKPVVDLCLKGN